MIAVYDGVAMLRYMGVSKKVRGPLTQTPNNIAELLFSGFAPKEEPQSIETGIWDHGIGNDGGPCTT